MMINAVANPDLTVLDLAPHGAIPYACVLHEPSVLPTFIPIGATVRVLGVVEPNGYHRGGVRIRRVVDGELVGGEEHWVR